MPELRVIVISIYQRGAYAGWLLRHTNGVTGEGALNQLDGMATNYANSLPFLKATP